MQGAIHSSPASSARSTADPLPSRWLEIVAEATQSNSPRFNKWTWLRGLTSRANADFTFRELAVFCATNDPPITSLVSLHEASELPLYKDLLTSTVTRLKREIEASPPLVPEWTPSYEQPPSEAPPAASGRQGSASSQRSSASLSLSEVRPDVLERLSGADPSGDLVVSMATAASVTDAGSMVHSVDSRHEAYGVVVGASSSGGLREASQSSLREVSDWREPSALSSESSMPMMGDGGRSHTSASSPRAPRSPSSGHATSLLSRLSVSDASGRCLARELTTSLTRRTSDGSRRSGRGGRMRRR